MIITLALTVFVGTNKPTVDTYTHMSIARANIKKY